MSPPVALNITFDALTRRFRNLLLAAQMRHVCFLVLFLSFPPTLSAAARAASPVLRPEIGQTYARPHQMVDVGGARRLNLDCRGKGAVTVVFDAGLSDWSSTWALVQPQVATFARACAYDRAGMGFSDPAGRPSTPAAIVEDLHALIRSAHIHRPVILVGHSMGGFNMKLYAVTYPNDVAGVVLVDPSEDRLVERAGGQARARLGEADFNKQIAFARALFTGYVAHLRSCADAARTHDLDPNSDLYKSCTDPARPSLGPEIAASRQVIQVKSSYLAAQASELAYGPFSDDPAADAHYAQVFGGSHPLGDRPLVVLGRNLSPNAQLIDVISEQLHGETAALSTRGDYRVVANTNHNIEIDQPQAIVDAIRQVLNALSARTSSQ